MVLEKLEVKVINLEEARKESIFGKIYMMASPSALHQDVVFNIAFEIKLKNKCKPRVAPYELKLECNSFLNKVQPDIMVFCEEEIPCAIFEVLSPSTAVKDKIVKKRLYECVGIKEYFLVEPEYKIIEKFELVDGEYKFVGNFSINDKLQINCIEDNIEVSKIFEGE